MKKLIVSGLLIFGVANIAFAQSTVNGTLTSGSSGGNSTSSVTGTVTSPSGGSSITGTVTSPTTSSGGSTSGGGGGGGSSPVVTDYCTNIGGVQSSLPAGYGVQNGVCTLLSTSGGTVTPTVPNTGGGTTVTPGVPNTGAGGSAAEYALMLTLAGIAAAVSTGYLLRRTV